jgi:YfiR/HmsC-like
VFGLQRQNQTLPTARTLPSWALSSVAVALSLLLASLPLRAQNSTTAEYRAKANYLANFPSFVEWPQEASSSDKAPFLICVFGEFPFGTSLAELTRSTTVHDRRIEIRWIRKPQELSSCQILFVSRSERKRYNQALDAVRGRIVLTVGETPEFLDAGGILSFSSQHGPIEFDVNLEAANKTHLKISSRLLALARRVVHQTEAAKS